MEVESNASEAYLHQLAGVFRFGRESLRPLTEKTHSITGARYLACRVRIWKPVLYMVCTTPKAEEMSVGPFGGLTYDEDVDINQDSSDINRPDIYVDWEATYSLSNKGEVRFLFQFLPCNSVLFIVTIFSFLASHSGFRRLHSSSLCHSACGNRNGSSPNECSAQCHLEGSRSS